MRVLSLALLTLSFACNDKGDDSAGGDDPHPALSLTGDATNGGTVFAAKCGTSTCHKADGAGGDGVPGLVGNVPGDADLVDIIANGTGSMPPQKTLSDQDIADVVAYCQDTFYKRPKTGWVQSAAARGRPQWPPRC